MNADLIEIQDNDVVMIHHNIEQLPSNEVDKYVKKMLPKLTEIFGKGRVAFFPVREGDKWDFTIIRKPIKKISYVKPTKNRRNN